MVGILHVFLRRRLYEAVFNLSGILPRGQPCAISHSKNMGIDGNFVLAVHHVQNNAGGFAANAGQRLERVTGVGHFAVVLVHYLLREANEVLGLHVVQANGLQVRLHAFDTQFGDRRGCVGNREQLAGCGVDRLVGCMRRKHDRYEQLKRRVVEQFRGGMWVGSLQSAKDGSTTGGIHVVFSGADARAVILREASNAACSSARRICRSLCA